jgi:hypothetical protein
VSKPPIVKTYAPASTTIAVGCDGKVAFVALKHALKAACRRKGRKVYRCRFCRHWHVTSPEPTPYVAFRRTKQKWRMAAALTLAFMPFIT